MLGNRLKSVFKHNEPFSNHKSNGAIRVKMKRIWGFNVTKELTVEDNEARDDAPDNADDNGEMTIMMMTMPERKTIMEPE